MRFTDRVDAGRRLARRLAHLRDADVVVLGLPRGGVPVAFEVAQALHAPLDVIVTRKLDAPFQPELTMGVVAENGIRTIYPKVLRRAGVGPDELAELERVMRVELDHRVQQLLRGRSRIPLAGRTALVVDDGITTGTTAEAACRAARTLGSQRIVLAVPVAPADAVTALGRIADEIVCTETPAWVPAISRWYGDFSPTSDEEVGALLERAAVPPAPAEWMGGPLDRGVDVLVEGGTVLLSGRPVVAR
ncbi:phosphoribosyltransferase family protein [Micromonospora sp. NBC_00898]|uniref:phosphoribosyltransferase n=1 Tax=Micromonospora sp. NBC_00898 TaxID=2975981 RepID=UPI003864C681|nr:phosphoribosyltransferase family protein [Micromonospora sp. NBC_00898]